MKSTETEPKIAVIELNFICIDVDTNQLYKSLDVDFNPE